MTALHDETQDQALSVSRVPAVMDPHAGIARANGWPYAPLDSTEYEIPREVLDLLEARVARQHNVIPYGIQGRVVVVACTKPDDLNLRAVLNPLFHGKTIRLAYADPAAIARKIEEVYSARAEAAGIAVRKVTRVQGVSDGGDLGRVESDIEGGTAQVLQLCIEQALRDGASDIHVEPVEDGTTIRFRVDGRMRLFDTVARESGREIVNIIKVGAKMRQDNSLTPESGVMVFQQPGKRDVDIRVETAPTVWGQTAVMRIQNNAWRDLADMGLSTYNEQRYREALGEPDGMIITTGPVTSGKTTLLYASLREKRDPETKIVAIEDPIEYKVPWGVTQIQVNTDQGMTLASAVRSVVRQDLNLALVGEIRDAATAEAAIDLAMVGRLVLTTLHTNTAPGAVTRLGRMGIEPLLIAETLRCVVGQRLLRRLCDTCKIEQPKDVDEIARLGFDPDRIPGGMYVANPDGCDSCRRRGYSGMVPIHEIMLVSPGSEIADAIADSAPPSVIRHLATAGGMMTMREDGFAKAASGLMTFADLDAMTRRSETA